MKSTKIQKFFFLLGACYLLIQVPLLGQRLTATSDKQVVTLGEYFQISWELSDADGDIGLPEIKNFEIVQGPMRSSSYTMVNGKTSSSVSESYVFRAIKEGTFVISPAIAVTRRGEVKSNQLTIKVIKGGASAQQNQSGQKGGGGQQNNQAAIDGEYFIKAQVSKQSIVQGEPFEVSYTFYLRNAGLNQFALKKMPQFNGFWNKDLPDQTDKQLREEVIEGKKYYVAIIKKAKLYPQKSGMLTIDALEADAIITLKSKAKRNPFFDDPFFSAFDDVFQTQEAVRKTIASNTLKINVKPLPELNKPDNFSGLVGNFKLKTSVNRTKLKAGDAFTYAVTVEGEGNIQQVEPFTLNFPPDWDVYDPKTLDKIGSRTFEYTVIPKAEGTYTLPSLEFSYFDLSTRSYKTLKGREIEMNIEKGSGNFTQSTPQNQQVNKEDVKLLGKDIRYINTKDTSFEQSGNSFFGSPTHWGFFVSPSLAFIALIAFKRKREKDLSDVNSWKKKSAGSVAKKRLKKANILLKAQNKELFYKEILQALYGYLSDSLSIQLADVNKEIVTVALSKNGLTTDEITQVIKDIDAFEFAAYAPTLGNNNLVEEYNKAEQLIHKLESQIKRSV